MGCGSSSLKGEPIGDITAAPAPVPLKKVATNFTDVNYEGANDRKTSHLADRAPDELDPPRMASVPEASTDNAQDPKLEPYHTVREAAPAPAALDMTYPHEAKGLDLYADKQRVKSRNANRGQSFSDDELLKYTGMTAEEIRARAKRGPGPPDTLTTFGIVGMGA